jgi:hypothetical protein
MIATERLEMVKRAEYAARHGRTEMKLRTLPLLTALVASGWSLCSCDESSPNHVSDRSQAPSHGWKIVSATADKINGYAALTIKLEHDGIVFVSDCDGSLPQAFAVCTKLAALVGNTLPDATRQTDTSGCALPGCIINYGPNLATGNDVLHFNPGGGPQPPDGMDAVLVVRSKTATE